MAGSAVDVSSFHRRNPCRWRPSPARIWPPGMLQSSGPAGAEVAPGWRRNGPGPDHRPRSSRAQARARRDPEPRDRIARPFQRGGLLLLALATFGVWWQWGNQVVGPSVGRRAPGFMRHGAGHAVLGAVAGYAFSLALQLWRLPCFVVGLPLCLGAGHAPPAITVGAAWRPLRRLLVPRWRCDRDMPPACRPFWFDKTGTLHRAGRRVIAVSCGGSGSGMRAGKEGLKLSPDACSSGPPALEQHTPPPGDGPWWRRLWPAVIAAGGLGGQPHPLGRGSVQGQIGGFDGGLSGRASLAGWRGWAYAQTRSCLASRTALRRPRGPPFWRWPPAMGFSGLRGRDDQPRPDAGRTLEALQAMGMDVAIPQRRSAPSGTPARRRALAWSQRQWPGAVGPEQKLEQAGALAPAGASGDAWAMGSTMPLPWPPPISAFAVRRAPRSPRNTGRSGDPGRSSRAVGRGPRPWPRDHDGPSVRQNLAWAFGYKPGDCCPSPPGLLLPRFRPAAFAFPLAAC